MGDQDVISEVTRIPGPGGRTYLNVDLNPKRVTSSTRLVVMLAVGAIFPGAQIDVITGQLRIQPYLYKRDDWNTLNTARLNEKLQDEHCFVRSVKFERGGSDVVMELNYRPIGQHHSFLATYFLKKLPGISKITRRGETMVVLTVKPEVDTAEFEQNLRECMRFSL